MSVDKLGTVVMKRFGHDPRYVESALVISTCDAPSFQLRAPDGSEYHWRQDFTREATAEEAAEYWRKRAESAEGRRHTR